MAGQGSQEERAGSADHQYTAEIIERGVAVFQRLADDDYQRLALRPDRFGAHPDGLVAGQNRLGRDRLAVASAGDLGGAQQRAPGDPRVRSSTWPEASMS